MSGLTERELLDLYDRTEGQPLIRQAIEATLRGGSVGCAICKDGTPGSLNVHDGCLAELDAQAATPPSPALDVERLARAIATAVGDPNITDADRRHAAAIAREYVATPPTDPGRFPDERMTEWRAMADATPPTDDPGDHFVHLCEHMIPASECRIVGCRG